jgi:holo-[acyl-carrier protein] synthase
MSGRECLTAEAGTDPQAAIASPRLAENGSALALPGIGVDIVNVQRLKTLYEHWREKLLIRLFTEQEQIICRKTQGYRWYSLAGRFSAKEAVKKILASRGEEANWTDIEIVNGLYGEPYINLSDQARLALTRAGYSRLALSISHDANLAIATVMAYT